MSSRAEGGKIAAMRLHKHASRWTGMTGHFPRRFQSASPVLLLAAVVSAIGIPVRSAGGQSVAGHPSVDSAASARAAFAVAVKASRENDFHGALSALVRASSAWPTQESYIWYRAVFAARTHDTAGTLSALAHYATLGLGRELGDSTFDRYRALSEFGRLEALHRENRRVLARSTVVATLGDSAFWPEGMDFDPITGAYYVGSLRRRTVVEVDRAGRERQVLAPSQPGVGSIMGVRVGEPGTLWATTVSLPMMDGWIPADTFAALLQVRIADGAVLRRVQLPSGLPHIPGDLAVSPAGDVLVTDSDAPRVYLLRAGRDTLESITSPLFRSLQGVAFSADPGVAYLADYSHGLLRLDLATGAVSRLAEPAHTTTLGIDGIAFHDNAIIAVQNGVSPARIMRFFLDDAGVAIVGAEVLDRHWTIADEPTIGTIAGRNFVYVANSSWGKHAPDGSLRPGAVLTRPVLLSVPVDR